MLRQIEGSRVTYVIHGEPASAATLRDRIDTELGWTAVVPAPGERVMIRSQARTEVPVAGDVRP